MANGLELGIEYLTENQVAYQRTVVHPRAARQGVLERELAASERAAASPRRPVLRRLGTSLIALGLWLGGDSAGTVAPQP